jgi:hypothetical protein
VLHSCSYQYFAIVYLNRRSPVSPTHKRLPDMSANK